MFSPQNSDEDFEKFKVRHFSRYNNLLARNVLPFNYIDGKWVSDSWLYDRTYTGKNCTMPNTQVNMGTETKGPSPHDAHMMRYTSHNQNETQYLVRQKNGAVAEAL